MVKELRKRENKSVKPLGKRGQKGVSEIEKAGNNVGGGCFHKKKEKTLAQREGR